MDSDQEISNAPIDSLANSIRDILNQETGKKIPLLAGRKTAMMKKLESSKKEYRVELKKREERRNKLKEKMDPTSFNNVEFERQLKKLATKGVVALFNAVSKAKKEMAEVKPKKIENSENVLILSKPNQLEASQKMSKKRKLDNNEDQLKNSNDSKKTKKGWAVTNDDLGDEVLMDWDQEEIDE